MTESSVAPAHAVEPLVLAIDVGTSSTRCLVYDGRARVVHSWEAYRPYRLTTSAEGRATVDPEFLLALTATCIDEVLAMMRAAKRRPTTVAWDTFWHSVIGLDQDSQPLTGVLTWADTRSAAAAQQLRHEMDQSSVHARTGAGLDASYLPAKIRWLQNSDPARASRVRFWMSFGEYAFLRLFGARRVSISMASGTGFFDQNACTWDTSLLDALNVRTDQLSPLADYSDGMTGLLDPYRSRWDELASIPWNLPLGDGACNNIGSGGISEEWPVVMIGTSGALRIVRAVKHITIPSGLWTYRVDRRRFVQGGALSAGGNVYAWLRQNLSLPSDADLEEEIGALPPDGHGLTVLPFLAGERSPGWNPDARAAYVGVGLDTTAAEIVQASYEAVAYRFGIVYELLSKVAPASTGMIGSGAGLIHSPVWMQIVCNVLGRPIALSGVPEATSRGAVLLALEAMGTIPDLAALPAPLGPKYAPVPKTTGIYRRAVARQESLYRVLKQWSDQEHARD